MECFLVSQSMTPSEVWVVLAELVQLEGEDVIDGLFKLAMCSILEPSSERYGKIIDLLLSALVGCRKAPLIDVWTFSGRER